MFDGEIVQFGTPEEIFNHPVNTTVADFMGATNLIEGTIASKGNQGTSLETTAGLLQLVHEPPQAIGETVTATVRPEHIDMLPLDGALAENRFRGKILDAVYYGGSLSYNVQAEGFTLQVRDRSTRRFSVGEEVMLHFDKEHLWIFPS